MARVVAAKCTLAARVDSFHENPEGEVGQGIQHVYLQMCISICYYTFWSGVAGLSARLPGEDKPQHHDKRCNKANC